MEIMISENKFDFKNKYMINTESNPPEKLYQTIEKFVKVKETIKILKNMTIKASFKPKQRSNVKVTTFASPNLAPGTPK